MKARVPKLLTEPRTEQPWYILWTHSVLSRETTLCTVIQCVAQKNHPKHSAHTCVQQGNHKFNHIQCEYMVLTSPTSPCVEPTDTLAAAKDVARLMSSMAPVVTDAHVRVSAARPPMSMASCPRISLQAELRGSKMKRHRALFSLQAEISLQCLSR
jgi:hypothetical protein